MANFPYKAIIQRSGEWWIGSVGEIPGVFSQGETREELLENLRSALEDLTELSRADALAEAAAIGPYEEVSLYDETA